MCDDPHGTRREQTEQGIHTSHEPSTGCSREVRTLNILVALIHCLDTLKCIIVARYQIALKSRCPNYETGGNMCTACVRL